MRTWDVVVVGAGPSGCAAAYDLVQAGKRVLLLDKALFPRPKLCAGGLTIKSLNRLRYSVAPVVQQISHSMGIGRGYGPRARFETQAPICALVVRAEFDQFCFERTCAAGAHFQQGSVTGVQELDGEVVLTLADGSNVHTRYLLGADGAHSQIRRLIHGDKPRMAVGLEAIVPRDTCTRTEGFRFDFGVVGQGYAWVFPKRDHFNVGLYTRDPHRFPLAKDALIDYSRFTLGSETLLDLRGFPIATGAEFCTPHLQRSFLIGDAGGYAEQLLGEGIHNALWSGQNAARALSQAHGEPAGALFIAEQAKLVRDIRRCTWVAASFYGLLPLGFFFVQAPPLREALMQGFAGGRTLSECAKFFLKGRPGCPPLETPTLREWQARNG